MGRQAAPDIERAAQIVLWPHPCATLSVLCSLSRMRRNTFGGWATGGFQVSVPPSPEGMRKGTRAGGWGRGGHRVQAGLQGAPRPSGAKVFSENIPELLPF